MLRPESIDDLLEAVRSNDHILAAGARTKPRLSRLEPDSGTALLDTTGLSGITEYEPSEFTFTALAGTPAQDVENVLAAEGQFLPFAPLLRGSGATLGGTVAAAFGGPGRFRFGGVRDFIIGIRFVDGQGRLISGGGKVVKNAAGFDLPKLMVGSLGRLGVLAELTFKVFPKPEATLTLKVPCPNARAATEKIVAAASSRWELQAIDYAPREASLFLRIGGPESANAAIADEIEEQSGGAVERLDREAGEAVWDEIRELRWASGMAAAVKVPITPREIVPLENELARFSGIAAHYSVGGNVAKIGLEEKRHAEDLDRLLRQLDLRGMAFFGEDVPLWFGDHPQWKIAAAIKQALDPVNRFPSL